MSRSNRGTLQAAARGWAHDRVCMAEGCAGDNEHAVRTQGGFAAAVVDWPGDDARVDAIHRLMCLSARNGTCVKASHVATCRDLLLPDLAAALDFALESVS